ncbi:MAG: archaeosortase/exosortase family protein [Candidatus Melainabacteria bacterium]|nr:archaeosortase/exosortase family protein [Candidatus Melainabacteria bacterium]
MTKAVLSVYQNLSYRWSQSLLLIGIGTFWPVWQWYFDRLTDPSDEPLGIVAVLTLLLLGAYKYQQANGNNVANLNFLSASNLRITLAIVAVLLCTYCAVIPVAPPIVSALLALAVCAVLLHRTLPVSLTPGDFALLALSLPVVASLNYYLGYPLRILACQMAAVMLNIGGLAVNVQGTEILSNNSIVGIDPPCSGIKMLWVALYLSATCASLRGLRSPQTLKLLAISLPAAIVANALRVSSLFYVESGIVPVSGVWHTLVHSGVGVAIFALSAAALVKVAYMLPLESKSSQSQTDKNIGIDSKANKLTTIASGCVVALFVFAAALPLAVNHVSDKISDTSFAGWPTQFEGQDLEPIKLSELTERFAKEFPGKIAVFTTGKSRIVYRWVTRPTLQLHPSANCYKASGYEIKWLPQYIDGNDKKWTAFQASKGAEKLLVRERIFDQAGHNWTDVSSWYWASVLKQSNSPWWAISKAERIE